MLFFFSSQHGPFLLPFLPGLFLSRINKPQCTPKIAAHLNGEQDADKGANLARGCKVLNTHETD